MSSEPLKMYFVAEERGPAWFYCYGVLSNGFRFGEHLCSHPNFAPGDLYLNRPTRMAALRELFGIEPGTTVAEMIVVRCEADVPTWWNDLYAKQDELKPAYERYAELVKEGA